MGAPAGGGQVRIVDKRHKEDGKPATGMGSPGSQGEADLTVNAVIMAFGQLRRQDLDEFSNDADASVV